MNSQHLKNQISCRNFQKIWKAQIFQYWNCSPPGQGWAGESGSCLLWWGLGPWSHHRSLSTPVFILFLWPWGSRSLALYWGICLIVFLPVCLLHSFTPLQSLSHWSWDRVNMISTIQTNTVSRVWGVCHTPVRLGLSPIWFRASCRFRIPRARCLYFVMFLTRACHSSNIIWFFPSKTLSVVTRAILSLSML
jgi:hypothetical protein